MRLLCALLCLSLAFAGSAFAHGAWIAQRHGELAVIYGHGASDEAYRPERVVAVAGRTAAGELREVSKLVRDKYTLLQPPADAAVLALTFDNGFWSKGLDGKFVNKGRRDVPGATASSHSVKLATKILAGTGGALRPKGLPLEIVPLVDVMKLKVGDDLPVQVLFEGKPLAGVALIADYVNDSHSQSEKTDPEGRTKLFVRNDGLNVIGVAHAKPAPDSPDVDRISYFATLSFSLPHGED
jgi:nickel transport protein